ncbi:MAG: MobF family relaxase [Hymenobacter sp.]
MIRMIQSTSAAHAKAYFAEALSKADYYLDDQELNGRIQGKLAERLGVTGTATKETFFAFCENVNPTTGQPLTPRTKDERTTGYDINFHCPKSVSIVHALSKDDHIITAFQDCVTETMRDIEADSKTRVRKDGQYNDRDTGELAWADFVHQTARPTEDAAPDPHLHAHCFVFNATWDETEKQCKAGQFRDIKRDMPYYQARFHKQLADKLEGLGYQIRRTDKSFELEGVPQQVIDLFSKRTNEIGQVAKEKGITDAKELSELGARTRSKKQKGLSMAQLKIEWRRQIQELGPEGKDTGGTIRYAPTKERPALTSNNALTMRCNTGSSGPQCSLTGAYWLRLIGTAWATRAYPLRTSPSSFARIPASFPSKKSRARSAPPNKCSPKKTHGAAGTPRARQADTALCRSPATQAGWRASRSGQSRSHYSAPGLHHSRRCGHG